MSVNVLSGYLNSREKPSLVPYLTLQWRVSSSKNKQTGSFQVPPSVCVPVSNLVIKSFSSSVTNLFTAAFHTYLLHPPPALPLSIHTHTPSFLSFDLITRAGSKGWETRLAFVHVSLRGVTFHPHFGVKTLLCSKTGFRPNRRCKTERWPFSL